MRKRNDLLLLATTMLYICGSCGVTAAAAAACHKRDQWTCKNGECIAIEAFCDGTSDCGDGSDERSMCHAIICPPYTFRCDYGACIPGSYRCNGVPDCVDASDEGVKQCSNGATDKSATRRPKQPQRSKPTTTSTIATTNTMPMDSPNSTAGTTKSTINAVGTTTTAKPITTTTTTTSTPATIMATNSSATEATLSIIFTAEGSMPVPESMPHLPTWIAPQPTSNELLPTRRYTPTHTQTSLEGQFSKVGVNNTDDIPKLEEATINKPSQPLYPTKPSSTWHTIEGIPHIKLSLGKNTTRTADTTTTATTIPTLTTTTMSTTAATTLPTLFAAERPKAAPEPAPHSPIWIVPQPPRIYPNYMETVASKPSALHPTSLEETPLNAGHNSASYIPNSERTTVVKPVQPLYPAEISSTNQFANKCADVNPPPYSDRQNVYPYSRFTPTIAIPTTSTSTPTTNTIYNYQRTLRPILSITFPQKSLAAAQPADGIIKTTAKPYAYPPHKYFHDAWKCPVPAHDAQLISKMFVNNRTYKVGAGEVLKEGTWIIYNCREGYTLSGTRSARCTRHGWTGAQPSCNKLYCSNSWIRKDDNCTWQGYQVECVNIMPETEVHIARYNFSVKWKCNNRYTWRRVFNDLLDLSIF